MGAAPRARQRMPHSCHVARSHAAASSTHSRTNALRFACINCARLLFPPGADSTASQHCARARRMHATNISVSGHGIGLFPDQVEFFGKGALILKEVDCFENERFIQE
jgi:hypothetical protein